MFCHWQVCGSFADASCDGRASKMLTSNSMLGRQRIGGVKKQFVSVDVTKTNFTPSRGRQKTDAKKQTSRNRRQAAHGLPGGTIAACSLSTGFAGERVRVRGRALLQHLSPPPLAEAPRLSHTGAAAEGLPAIPAVGLLALLLFLRVLASPREAVSHRGPSLMPPAR